jgi:hypothetical protein
MRGNITPGGSAKARISDLFWDAVPRLRTSLHEHANREQDDYDDDYDLDHGSDHFVSLLGSRAMSNRDVGVRRIGPLIAPVNELL